jgi:hypothetical protein
METMTPRAVVLVCGHLLCCGCAAALCLDGEAKCPICRATSGNGIVAVTR